MKVDVGEGESRPGGAVAADERQTHEGYTINDTQVEVGRSGPDRAVAVAQQHQAGGAPGAIGSVVAGGTAAAAAAGGGVLGVGLLPVRNGVVPVRAGGEGAAVVALHHQHPGGSSVDERAFVGSDEYCQVRDFGLITSFACCCFHVLLLLLLLAGTSCLEP